MLNNVDSSMVKKRFNRAVLLELKGGLASLEGPSCEVVEIYHCPHRLGMYTIVHIPGGSVPPNVEVEGAMPMDYSF